jgi:hypothetical protein
MKQTFDLNAEQFHFYLLQTVSANKSYRISLENFDRNRCTLYCPEKAIVIDCHIVPGNGSTECYLSATSPFCVISAAHEQSILTDLLSRLHTSIAIDHSFAIFHSVKKTNSVCLVNKA